MKKIGLLTVFIMNLVFLTFGVCGGLNSSSEVSASTTTQTFTLQPGPNDGKDAIIQSRIPGTNYGNDPRVMAIDWTWSGTPGVIRSLLGFDLSWIPTGSVINNASLSLYAWDGSSPHSTLSGSNACWIKRITSSWTEGTVTWNNQPTTTTFNQVALPTTTSSTQNYTDINVTAMVQDMINSPSAGYGMMLCLQNEAYYRNMSFCSSDHPNPALRPKLVVTYSDSLPVIPVSISGPTELYNNTPMAWNVVIPSSLQNYNIKYTVQRGNDPAWTQDNGTNKYISFSAYSPTPITISLQVKVTAPGYKDGYASILIYTRFNTGY